MESLMELKNHMDGERLTAWPSKGKLKTLALQYLVSKFELGKEYSEKEVNEIINHYHTFQDAAMLRRAMCDQGLLTRTRDGSRYWKTGPRQIPVKWETERLTVENAKLEEVDPLSQLNKMSNYMVQWEGLAREPDAILKKVTEGDLPPGGKKELYRIQAIRLKDTGRLVGILEVYHGYPTDEVFWIGFLFIHPDFQQMGLGMECIDQLKMIVKANGYSAIRLGVALKNWPAIRFWLRNGFDRVVKYSGDSMISENTFAFLVLEYPL
jgi:ribosomal protein S18 acetylase RimI-like enzyme